MCDPKLNLHVRLNDIERRLSALEGELLLQRTKEAQSGFSVNVAILSLKRGLDDLVDALRGEEKK